MTQLRKQLPAALDEHRPDFVLYNAGAQTRSYVHVRMDESFLLQARTFSQVMRLATLAFRLRLVCDGAVLNWAD